MFNNGDAVTNNRGAGASSPQSALDEAKRITVVRSLFKYSMQTLVLKVIRRLEIEDSLKTDIRGVHLVGSTLLDP